MFILKSEYYSTKMKQCLTIDTLKIAKEELREDESTRDNALNQMRLWLKQNNKIIHSRSGKYYFIFNYYLRLTSCQVILIYSSSGAWRTSLTYAAQ